MGLINRLFPTRPNPRQPRSKAEGVLGYYRTPDGRVIAIKMSGYGNDFAQFSQAAPSDLRADDAGLITAYFASVFAFRCVETRANKIASIPFNVIDRKTGEVLPDTTLARALDWAYTKYQQDIFYLWEFSRTVYGETYLEPVYNLFGQPIGVRWLNPLCIEPYEGANGIEWFDYQASYGATHRYKPDEIVFERRFNPANDYRGYGRMSAALDAINIDRNLQTYVKKWFSNGAQPGMMLTPKENTIINPTDVDRMREAVNANVKGVRNWFSPWVMPVPLDVTVISAPPLSEQQVLKEDVRIEICAALGVPIGLVAHDSVRYQLSAEQRNTFYEEEIVPECAAIERAATSMLLPFFGDDMRYECKFDVGVLGTQVDMEQRRADSAASQFAAGGLSYHEYRAALGKGAPEGEDFVMLPADRVAVPVSQLGNAPALISAAQTPAPAFGMGAIDTPAPLSIEDAAVSELGTWQRYTAKHGASKAADKFACSHVPEDVQAFVRGALISGEQPARDVFTEARKRLDEPVSPLEEDGFAELFNIWSRIGLTSVLDSLDRDESLTSAAGA